MTTERDRAKDNTIRANLREDHDLDMKLAFCVDRPTLAALDQVVKDEGWTYRAPFMRSVLVAALKQRGLMPM